MATVQSSKATNDKNKSRGASKGQRTEAGTGERDENYNLISVLYHALQGADTVQKYVRDAEDDEQLAQFFEEARASYMELAQQAKQLLAERLEVEEGEEEEEDDD